MACVIDTWQSTRQNARRFVVIPDGCRDLIYRISPDKRPTWTLSSLDDSAYSVAFNQGVMLRGFRLKAGTVVQDSLWAGLDQLSGDNPDVVDMIENHTSLSNLVADSLASLESGAGCVAKASRLIGVNHRRMQRALLAHTGRTAAAWLSLSRARQAARAVISGEDLRNIAADFGYADQPHMTREFRRWFGITPARLHLEPDIAAQLKNPAFG